jgi:hypothetical protein
MIITTSRRYILGNGGRVGYARYCPRHWVAHEKLKKDGALRGESAVNIIHTDLEWTVIRSLERSELFRLPICTVMEL